MSANESIKKMLRSVLQSSKEGVLLSRLPQEYRSLCGENIPLKKLGFSSLEDYMRSIPSVVRMEHRMGELKCFAAVCKETAHIAELVARQKSAKKSGHSQVINCSLRFKRSDPYMLNIKPRSSLRQPSAAGGGSNWKANTFLPHGGYRGFSASGDHRQSGQKMGSIIPVVHRIPASQQAVKRNKSGFTNCDRPGERPPDQVSRTNQSQSSPYNPTLVQSRVTQLLQKYCSGVWMSKLSEVYQAEFQQKLHPQAIFDLDKWTHICMVEKPSSIRRGDRLIYPPLPSSSLRLCSPAPNPAFPSRLTPSANHSVSGNVERKVNKNSPTATLNHKRNIKSLVSTQTDPASTKTPPVSSDPDILPLLKITFPPSSDSAPCPPSKSSVVAVPAEVRQRIKELLVKYGNGLWVSALPKLFMDTFKAAFPEYILQNLHLLRDICNVEYVTSRETKKAILYYSSRADTKASVVPEGQQGRPRLPSGLDVVGPAVPPRLDFPPEQFPSVLITDAKSSNTVTIRYVGENYSNAQEAMEDAMLSFYGQNSSHRPSLNPVVGQLVAVRGQDGDELARAQVTEVISPNKVKVYYVDYGFSVETTGTDLLELHQKFFFLPFQATDVRLAGLETFSSHTLLLSTLDKLAVGKILLMETLEPGQQNEMPTVVLYDTSQDDDVIINSTCLMALHDKTMNNPLAVEALYPNVCVTNVCANGTICCQLPSRGTARLSELLEETEVLFASQVTSESLVSTPFTGKLCLARFKDKWSRVEITKMHGRRVMEITFTDFGLPATVEVTDLREIPPFLLKDFSIIPPQVTKCRLADLMAPEGDWSPEAVLWVKEAVLGSEDCKMKIVRLDQSKDELLVYMHLFICTDGQELDKSINHQLAQTPLWHQLKTLNSSNNNNTITKRNGIMDSGKSTKMEKTTGGSVDPQPILRDLSRPPPDTTTKTEMQPLLLPPLLELPQPGQNMDVFVPMAYHPGHFVLQQWQEMHKLVVLMGEMILYYNRTWRPGTAPQIQIGEVCAAKLDNNWHRVQVKRILANGLVSVYELDHGKQELVHCSLLQPLIEEFRYLPFQAISAQLAGVPEDQWSDEASALFRKHAEYRALVAQVVGVQEAPEGNGEPWERKLKVYLVDTSSDNKDLWIHTIMADICGEISSAT